MVELTDEAVAAGVQVYPVTLDADQAWLEDIAEETFGTYTNIPSAYPRCRSWHHTAR